MPGAAVDLTDPESVIEVFHQAAQANAHHPRRRGAVVELPAHGRLLMTGDLHDNALNFQKILKIAHLDKSPDNYLILHEIVHGEHQVNGRDLSIRLLARVAALKLAYPDQLLLMQANHELAQLGGEGILKGSISVVDAFDAGVEFLYSDRAEAVEEAMHEFIRSLLLAVRCENGIFCSHSLPSPRRIDNFDKTVLDRVPSEADLSVDGSAYLMVWGRNHTQKTVDELAQAWGAKVFVMGHQPAEMGFELEADSILILASDHEHGMALPIDLSKTYTRDELEEQLVPLASVTV